MTASRGGMTPLIKALLVLFMTGLSQAGWGYEFPAWVDGGVSANLSRQSREVREKVEANMLSHCRTILASEGSLPLTAIFSSRKDQLSYERSRCFDALAQRTGNPVHCAEVKQRHAPFANGSYFSPTECEVRVHKQRETINALKALPEKEPPSPERMHKLTRGQAEVRSGAIHLTLELETPQPIAVQKARYQLELMHDAGGAAPWHPIAIDTEPRRRYIKDIVLAEDQARIEIKLGPDNFDVGPNWSDLPILMIRAKLRFISPYDTPGRDLMSSAKPQYESIALAHLAPALQLWKGPAGLKGAGDDRQPGKTR